MAVVPRAYDEGTYDGALYDSSQEAAGLPPAPSGASSWSLVQASGGAAAWDLVQSSGGASSWNLPQAGVGGAGRTGV